LSLNVQPDTIYLNTIIQRQLAVYMPMQHNETFVYVPLRKSAWLNTHTHRRLFALFLNHSLHLSVSIQMA